MASNYMITAKEVSEILGTSVPFAYSVIRKLNAELEAEGYVVVSGKVPRAYWETRFFTNGAVVQTARKEVS